MKAQTAKRMIRLQDWAVQINDCKQSGKTVIRWCEEHGINTKTFYNRMRVVREEMLEIIESGRTNWIPGAINSGTNNMLIQPGLTDFCGRHSAMQKAEPVFAALPMPQTKSATVTVQMGEYSVGIQNGADSTIVEQVLRVVARL